MARARVGATAYRVSGPPIERGTARGPGGTAALGTLTSVTSPMRPHPSPTRRRLARAGAVAAVGLSTLGLSACQWTSPITTQLQYDPSDGKAVSVGPITVHNALIVAGEKDGLGALFGTLENTSPSAQTVQIKIGDETLPTVDVPAGKVVRLSPEGKPAKIAKVPAMPGGMTEVVFATASGAAAPAQLPVLAPQGPYASVVPGLTPAPTPSGASSKPAAGH